MRWTVMLLATMVMALIGASGVAIAATIQCKGGVACYGTNKADTLYGTAGDNAMYAKRGADYLNGYGGSDSLFGQEGSDTLLGGSYEDHLTGGPGNDTNDGGTSPDLYSYPANNWGHDTIIEDTLTPDNCLGCFLPEDRLDFPQEVTTPLVINLSSGADYHEVTNADGTSTIDWQNNVIEYVMNWASGDDTVHGNNADNLIHSHNGVDQVYGEEGNDDIIVLDGQPGDHVDCGDGANDYVAYDAPTATSSGDTVTNCEHLDPVG